MHDLATIARLNRNAEAAAQLRPEEERRPMTYAAAQAASARSPFNQANWPSQGVKTSFLGYQPGR